MVRLTCPNCRNVCKAPDQAEGKAVACPSCRKPIRVPVQPGAVPVQVVPIVQAPEKPKAPTVKTWNDFARLCRERPWIAVAGIVGLLLLVVVGLVVAGQGQQGKAAKKAEAETKAKAPAAPGEAAINVVRLYQSDRKTARQMFSGRRVRVFAPVWQIRSSDVYLSSLDRQDRFLGEGVWCRMVDGIPGDVGQGDWITVEGRCEGLAFDQLQMHDCRFIGKGKLR